MKNILLLLLLLPLFGTSQINPIAATAFGTNFGTGLHADVELGVEFGRVYGGIQYRRYFGADNESSIGFKTAIAAIYTNSSNLCYIAPFISIYHDNYTDVDGIKHTPNTFGFGFRVQTYNVYWEISRQQEYIGFTVGYQFRKRL